MIILSYLIFMQACRKDTVPLGRIVSDRLLPTICKSPHSQYPLDDEQSMPVGSAMRSSPIEPSGIETTTESAEVKVPAAPWLMRQMSNTASRLFTNNVSGKQTYWNCGLAAEKAEEDNKRRKNKTVRHDNKADFFFIEANLHQ